MKSYNPIFTFTVAGVFVCALLGGCPGVLVAPQTDSGDYYYHNTDAAVLDVTNEDSASMDGTGAEDASVTDLSGDTDDSAQDDAALGQDLHDPCANMQCGDYESCHLNAAGQATCRCFLFVDLNPSIQQRDGKAWGSAYNNIQNAIDQAASLGTTCQVWVAAGTYNIYSDSRADTLALSPSVELYGGFVGTETELDQRDHDVNATVISGANSDGANVYHVVTGANDAVLDGFTIRDGQADGTDDNGGGGGMINIEVAPVVRNCIFTDNSGDFGGGMGNTRASPLVENTRFESNSADLSGGGVGNNRSFATFSNCHFEDNSAVEGAGMGNAESSPLVSGCFFVDNSASRGGGMGNTASSPQIINTVFSGNSAVQGAGLGNSAGSEVSVTNCTFDDNMASLGGGAIGNEASNLSVHNTIIWNNQPDGVASSMGQESVTHSITQGHHSGTGNISADPLFAADSWQLTLDSPAIDTADDSTAPTTDTRGHNRKDIPDRGITGVLADMGAYEYQ